MGKEGGMDRGPAVEAKITKISKDLGVLLGHAWETAKARRGRCLRKNVSHRGARQVRCVGPTRRTGTWVEEPGGRIFATKHPPSLEGGGTVAPSAVLAR